MNIDATATIRKKVKIGKDGKIIDEPEIKSHHYEVTGFGGAPYKFNSDNEQSYYVNYKTPTGKKRNYLEQGFKKKLLKKIKLMSENFVVLRLRVSGR